MASLVFCFENKNGFLWRALCAVTGGLRSIPNEFRRNSTLTEMDKKWN